jgi:hypothetical protein
MYSAYTGFERIVRVYTFGYALVSADVSAYCEHIEFTLSCTKGCCEATIVTIPTPSGAMVFGIGNIVELIPQTGAAAWYTGIVGDRSWDSTTNRFTYKLDGIAAQFAGIAPVTTETDFGTGGGEEFEGFTENETKDHILYDSDNITYGIIPWLVRNATTGIIYQSTGMASGSYDYDFSFYMADNTVELVHMSPEMNVMNVLEELAGIYEDTYPSHSTYPYPFFWGVGADRKFYAGFRPNTKLLTLKVGLADADGDTIGHPTLRLTDGTRIDYEGCNEAVAGMTYNVLIIYGGCQTDGTVYKETFEDAASIAADFRRRLFRVTVPTVCNLNDGQRFANAFFAKYAKARASYFLRGLILTAATALPIPHTGYCEVVSNSVGYGAEAGKRTIKTVHVLFNESPRADVTIGEIEFNGMIPSDGNTRTPGTAWTETRNREPHESEGLSQAIDTGGTGGAANWYFRNDV